MSSGYTVNGTDLDSIFLSGSIGGLGNTGYAVNGTDLAGRYHRSLGSGDRSATTTNYRVSGGADLNTLFRRAGFTPVSVTISPSQALTSLSGGVYFTSISSIIATAANGSGSYSYAWTFIEVTGYNLATFSVAFGSESSASGSFDYSNGADTTSSTGRFRVTVTDNGTGETATADFLWTVEVA
jgi:hypothetical protein